jgi:phosphoglucosamine mutase
MARLFGPKARRCPSGWAPLIPTLAYALGRAVAHRLVGRGGAIVVGQDTRRSGDMFVAAIAAGATSMGVDAHIVGVVPTPALAFMAGQGPFAAGIMVSASHNPAVDNGLKVLDRDGLKLAIRSRTAGTAWRTEELPGATRARPTIDASSRLDDYRAHRLALGDRCQRPAPLCSTRTGRGPVGRAYRRRPAPRRRHHAARRYQHQRRVGGTAPASLAEASSGARRRRVRPGDDDRLIAVDAGGAWWTAIRCSYRLDRLSRTTCGAGPVVLRSSQRRPGTSSRRPVVTSSDAVGDKYILEGMRCRRGPRWREERPRIILEHTTSGDGTVTALESCG